MKLSGLVSANHLRVQEKEGRHFMCFWDKESLICLEDEMIYDAGDDGYYLPRYIWQDNLIVRAGRGMIWI